LTAWLREVGVDASPLAYGITDAETRIREALSSPRGRNFIGAAVGHKTPLGIRNTDCH
jgi:hypothetical protein